ncbi:MAG: sigma-54-dependent Fis family transcriptional regulator [Fibrobacteres bacterium]|nr:sigma-54-dependent Fis family transcriptional regulator [Fibrobacterota bacterium]
MQNKFEKIRSIGMGNPFRMLYISMDMEGRINDVFSHSRFIEIKNELLETGSINPYFPWLQKRDECLATGTIAGRSIKNFRYFSEDRNFYTSLPLSYFYFDLDSDGTVFVQCSFHEIIPNIFTDRHSLYVYIDSEKGILKGFNRFFYEQLKTRYKKPDDLLDQRLKRIFQNFPTYKESVEYPKVNKTKTIHESGLCEITASNKHVYQPITEFADVSKGEIGVRLSAAFTAQNKSFPLLFLGDVDCNGVHAPDVRGYLAGPNIDKRGWIIKRRGYVVADAPMVDFEKFESASLTLVGKDLIYEVNGKTVLTYSDQDMLLTEKVYATVGVRPNEAVRISSVNYSVISVEKRNSDIVVPEVTLDTVTGERIYSLERFFNDSVTDSPYFYYPYAGYFLNDITEFRGKVNRLEKEVKRYEPLASDLKIIGNSASAGRIREWVKRVAATDATVLIEGATGTGKEVVARNIHSMSGRAEMPFVKVDCSTIPESLMESHLFGHEKGAFTGADSRFIGVFEGAGQGTIFLDEISNLSLSVQAKLLLTLNDFTITRIGGREPIKLKARIIGASNLQLSGLIKKGLFRSDLYYRLSVFQLTLPDLNSRIEDLPELCTQFLSLFNLVYNKSINEISESALKKMIQHKWSGNIRELRNCIEQAVLFCGEDRIEAEHIIFREREDSGNRGARVRGKEVSDERMVKTNPEKVVSLLKMRKGRVAAVARELGTSTGALYYFLKKNGINVDDYRSGF